MDRPLNWSELGGHFGDEEKARLLLEMMRWPNGGPSCPICKKTETVYRMQKRAESVKPGRAGLLRCRACKKQFTVTTGTVFEDSHIPMTKWLQAIYLLCSSKKGISAHQLHRMLGVTYKSAWFMAHRLRYAMSVEPMVSKLAPRSDKLSGIVEVDETYVGGKRNLRNASASATNKTPVLALVERGGRVRCFPMERVTSREVQDEVRKLADLSSHMVTDELNVYHGLDMGFASHNSVTHSKKEYVRGWVHTNSVEGFFSLLKRGINGIYHHVGKGHLAKYCDEFAFRYDLRKVSDAQRAEMMVWGAEGKRLTYKQPAGSQ
jgi:transposase-like protein